MEDIFLSLILNIWVYSIGDFWFKKYAKNSSKNTENIHTLYWHYNVEIWKYFIVKR